MKRATNLKEKLKNTPENLLKAKRFKENLPWFKDMGTLKYNAEDLYDKVLEIQKKILKTDQSIIIIIQWNVP